MSQTLVVLIGFAVLFVTIFGLIAWSERARKRRIEAALRARGFMPNMNPSEDEKLSFFAQLSHIDSLKQGAKGVRWFASGQLDGRQALLCEHAYTTGSGESSKTHVNTVAAVAAPEEWSVFTLTPESIFSRLGERLGLAKDLKLENEKFNNRWRVRCSSDETALVVLTPEVQEFLVDSPPQEWWCIGQGRIACGRSSALSDTTLIELLERTTRVIGVLAPEVREMLPRK